MAAQRGNHISLVTSGEGVPKRDLEAHKWLEGKNIEKPCHNPGRIILLTLYRDP